MSKHNPRIEAQRNILHDLLAKKPNVESFDAAALRDWQQIGMGPRFYLYNGIEAFARVVEDLLATLDAEETEWKRKREANET